MWYLTPNLMPYKTFRGANDTGKEEQGIPPGPSLDPPESNPLPPTIPQWPPTTPKWTPSDPKYTKYSPSKSSCLITCWHSQNYQIFAEIPEIAQYSLSTTGALFALWCSLYKLPLKTTNNQVSYISMLTSIFGCFDPKQCLTEWVDAL